MINEKSYDNDTKSPQIIRNTKKASDPSWVEESQRPAVDVVNQGSTEQRIGETKVWGEDWSLISLQDSGLALPNTVTVDFHIVYLMAPAKTPISKTVAVLAGVEWSTALEDASWPGQVRHAVRQAHHDLETYLWLEFAWVLVVSAFQQLE